MTIVIDKLGVERFTEYIFRFLNSGQLEIRRSDLWKRQRKKGNLIFAVFVSSTVNCTSKKNKEKSRKQSKNSLLNELIMYVYIYTKKEKLWKFFKIKEISTIRFVAIKYESQFRVKESCSYAVVKQVYTYIKVNIWRIYKLEKKC